MDRYIPDLYDLCDLYDLAHVAGWEPYILHDLHDLAQYFLGWMCTTVYRSCNASENGRLGFRWSKWCICRWSVSRVGLFCQDNNSFSLYCSHMNSSSQCRAVHLCGIAILLQLCMWIWWQTNGQLSCLCCCCCCCCCTPAVSPCVGREPL